MGHDALMKRSPPAVKAILRKEVGFGCPYPGCSNPYLEYHHFDPPWHVQEHNNPEGMIALCSDHHYKAEAWTPEDLRRMKAGVDPKRSDVAGRFEWMKRKLLAIVGGNYYHETPVIIAFHDMKIVWFTRDVEGRLLLSAQIPTVSGEPRLFLDKNDWAVQGEPVDVESGPTGKTLDVKYDNGDEMFVQFKEWPTLDDLAAKHEFVAAHLADDLEFPLTTVEVNLSVGGTTFHLSPTGSKFGPCITLTGNVVVGGPVGLQLPDHGGFSGASGSGG